MPWTSNKDALFLVGSFALLALGTGMIFLSSQMEKRVLSSQTASLRPSPW